MAVNIGPLVDAENRFRQGYIEFARNWAVVKENWLDDRRRRFEEERLSTLGPCLSRFTASLHEFEDVIRKAERELRDSDRTEDGLS